MEDDRPIVILTRHEAASRRFALLLDEALDGAAGILIAPVMAIVPVTHDGDYSQYQTLIFTSENAVRHFGDPGPLAGRTAYCVGDRTAAVAAEHGYVAISAAGDSEALAARLLADRPRGPWLHPTGADQRVDLARRFSEAGHKTRSVIVYRQAERPLGPDAECALRHRRVVLPVFSPRSAAILSAAFPKDGQPASVVAISAATAGAWTGPAQSVRIAASPDASAMVDAIRASL